MQLKKLINRFFRPQVQPRPELPDNIRIYCIGDIHGRNDLLQKLLLMIQEDSLGFNGQIYMIYVGDYIDRGMQSQEVIETLLGSEQAGIHYVYLRGNHEQTLLDFLMNADVGRSWLSYGGQSTLASYKVNVNKIPTKREEFNSLREQLATNIPPSHYAFYQKTQSCFELGNYFFVHAGVHPKYPLSKQQAEDMLWIREEFINSHKNYEKIIVHGHTVTEQVEILPHRIGIDTGAYSSGILSCLVLESTQQRILQT